VRIGCAAAALALLVGGSVMAHSSTTRIG
jgi:hypothetical protein